MGWVIRDAVIRLRGELGIYYWYQWRVCLRDIGCKLVWTPESDPSRGSINCRTIYIRRGMSKEETAEVAWHEISHRLLHAGTTRFWSSRPGGHLVVQRFEIQATEFANTFPIWPEDDG